MMNQNYQNGLNVMQGSLGQQIQGQLGGQQAQQQAISGAQSGINTASGLLQNTGNILNQTTVPAQAIAAVGGQNQAMSQAQLSEQVQKYINQQLIPFSTAQDVAAMAFGMPGGSTKSVSSAPGNPMAGIQAGASAIGSLAPLLMKSDRLLKKDIRKIDRLVDGLNVYAFKYIDDLVERIGLMADEVEVLYPEAIMIVDGYKNVDYSLPSWLGYRS
jgi:hypothetical protein